MIIYFEEKAMKPDWKGVYPAVSTQFKKDFTILGLSPINPGRPV